MKQISILIALLSCVTVLWAQTPIDQARNTSVGQTVTISGTVTNGSELGVIRYMQDATAGLPIYDSGFANAVNRGDSVTVTGEMTIYNGLKEIVNVTSYTVHASGKTVTPVVVTPSGMGSSNEGQLIQINNVTFSNPGGTFTNGTLSFSNGVESSNIYLSSAHSLVGTIIPQTAVNLVGLSSRFNTSAQLILRDINDITIASTFYLTTAVEQSNLTTSSFDLSWETNTAGVSHVLYGTDRDNLNTHATNGNTTTQHNISLTGLNAGEIYYARAYAVNGNDTAWSAPAAYATVSNSSGQIRVYFNQVVDYTVSTGTPAAYLTGSDMENMIISYIDAAQTTVDVAIYNISRIPILNALKAAHNRGVQVRLIADDGTANTALQNGSPNFNWFTGNANGLMHNKFIIIDAESTNDAVVFMGSMNFTDGEVFDNFNSVLFIRDQSLARAYTLEFEEMWGTSGPTFGIFSRKLGEDKTQNTPTKFLINGIPMELYFSPTDGTTAAIAQALGTADSKIEFATLTFTRNDLRDVIIDRFNAGVQVRGMIENINDTGGEYSTLVGAGIPMKHHSDSHLLHHKYGIVDADAVNSDPQVIVGCHNWTSSAEERNDENTLIIHDATIANLYTQEFNARWVGLITNTRNVVLGLEGFDVSVLGNPVQDAFRFQITTETAHEVTVQLFSATGQLLHNQSLGTLDAGMHEQSIATSMLPAGSYIALFQVDNVAVSKTFVIAR